MLAAAGLKRLALESRIRECFEPDQMLPAAGQGALGIEVRAERADLLALLAPLDSRRDGLATAAERAVSRAMGGSCSMPLAAYATLAGGELTLRAAWGDAEGGGTLLRAEGRAAAGDLVAARRLGGDVAAQLRAAGAH